MDPVNLFEALRFCCLWGAVITATRLPIVVFLQDKKLGRYCWIECAVFCFAMSLIFAFAPAVWFDWMAFLAPDHRPDPEARFLQMLTSAVSLAFAYSSLTLAAIYTSRRTMLPIFISSTALGLALLVTHL